MCLSTARMFFADVLVWFLTFLAPSLALQQALTRFSIRRVSKNLVVLCMWASEVCSKACHCLPQCADGGLFVRPNSSLYCDFAGVIIQCLWKWYVLIIGKARMIVGVVKFVGFAKGMMKRLQETKGYQTGWKTKLLHVYGIQIWIKRFRTHMFLYHAHTMLLVYT